ncbi:MAG: hypothetical protein AAFO07_10305 [Bacteroidota bacterium]
MSSTDIRAESHQILDRIDERFLVAVHALLSAYDKQAEKADDEIIGYQLGTDKPIMASEADDTFEAIIEDVKRGNFVEIDDLIEQKSTEFF